MRIATPTEHHQEHSFLLVLILLYNPNLLRKGEACDLLLIYGEGDKLPLPWLYYIRL